MKKRLKNDPEEQRRHAQLIQKLATRLPWIVVLAVVLTVLVTFLQLIWK